MGGLRARRLEGSGIVSLSIDGEGAMHGSDKGVLVRHDPGREVGGAGIARRLRIGRRSVDNWIADGTLDTGDRVYRYGPRPARSVQMDPFKGIIAARWQDDPQLGAVRLPDESKAAGDPGR